MHVRRKVVNRAHDLCQHELKEDFHCQRMHAHAALTCLRLRAAISAGLWPGMHIAVSY